MSERKPWMVPCQYNDDRFDDRPFVGQPNHMDRDDVRQDDPDDERDERDVEEILRRPDRREERKYTGTDTTPINYRKGPHTEEFGVEESDFDQPDEAPVPYQNGPNDEEFGLEDESEELDED